MLSSRGISKELIYESNNEDNITSLAIVHSLSLHGSTLKNMKYIKYTS